MYMYIYIYICMYVYRCLKDATDDGVVSVYFQISVWIFHRFSPPLCWKFRFCNASPGEWQMTHIPLTFHCFTG